MAEPEVVIVLDDLHHISNAVLMADLLRLVELVARNVHIVLVTRIDLRVAWSRYGSRLGITEIRQADLALDAIDSAQTLEHIAGRAMSADRVTALLNRTEVWAAIARSESSIGAMP